VGGRGWVLCLYGAEGGGAGGGKWRRVMNSGTWRLVESRAGVYGAAMLPIDRLNGGAPKGGMNGFVCWRTCALYGRYLRATGTPRQKDLLGLWRNPSKSRFSLETLSRGFLRSQSTNLATNTSVSTWISHRTIPLLTNHPRLIQTFDYLPVKPLENLSMLSSVSSPT
jgi:hypothetical protein